MSEKETKSSENFANANELIPGYSSVEQFTKDGFKTLVEAIKHSGALPSGRDLDFYNTSDSFKRIISNESDNVTRLMNQIMRCNEMESNIRNRILDEKIELIIEANDIILEKVANNIDELNGIRKSTSAPVVLQTVSAQPINGSWNRSTAATFTVNSTQSTSNENCIKLLTAKNIIRPQKFFKDKIDNRNKVPWCPRITDKPNSLKPLSIFLEESEFGEEYSHPYEYELDRFAPTSEQLLYEKPQQPKPLSETSLVEITKPEELNELVETLRNCKEFAVDVEHHSYRSFMGITCLLQISTESTDYLIDTLALRDKLYVLNEVFTRNNIVKIFHGADNDIKWLQRDLSIYVVNMFDTHQAAKALQYPALSLAFLLKKFCNIAPNKQFQLADWRIRPLPDELKSYAREDTHYLIYIYKMLKNELLAKANKANNILKAVIEQGTELCRKRYLKPILNDDSHLELYRKCKKMFDNRQMYALKEIFAWRDNLAREEDESLGYVLPSHMLLQISESLPREMQGILACCNPIPPLVRSHLLELHHIVLKAREQPLEKAIMKDTTGRGVLKAISKVNVESGLHCPHDLSKTVEFRDDLPTLLKSSKLKDENNRVVEAKLAIEKKPSYSIFKDENSSVFDERKTFKKLRGFAYLSPYERYLLVKPFVVAETAAEEAKKEETQKEIDKKNEESQSKETVERTDDERIASIQNHFMELSKKFSEELEQQKQEEEEKRLQQEQSLLQMGGSRKRKREDECDYGFIEDRTPDFNNTLPEMNQFYGSRGKGKKRKFSEISGNNSEQHMQTPNSRKNKKQQKKKNKNQQQNVQQEQFNQDQNPVQKKKNKQLQKFRGLPNLQKSPKKNKQPKNLQQPQPQGSSLNKRRNRNQNFQNDNFAPYDYASVDFRQFQGGAESASSRVQVRSNHKGKQNRKNPKKGAKSATFGGFRQGRGGNQSRNYF